MEAEPKGEKVGKVVVGWRVTERGWCQTHRSTPPQEADQEQRWASDHPSAFGGHMEMWVIFSPRATPAPAQKTEQTPVSRPLEHLEEPDAGAGMGAPPALEGCPP